MLGYARRSLVVVAALFAFACGSDDTKDSSNGAAGMPPVGGAGTNGGEGVTFCEALAVLRSHCQQCHGDPLTNGAPVPFLTYEDTQVPYFEGSDETYAERMGPAVEKDAMPPLAFNDPPISVMPPLRALTAQEKATLLGWVQQGAKPVGGTDCR